MFIFIPLFNYRTLNSSIIINNFQELLLYKITIDKRCSVVHRGVSHDGRFVGGDARNQEPDGDTRRKDSDLDRFGPSARRNTLRPVSLVDCIDLDD